MEKNKSSKKVFPCPLCQKGLDIRISKKQKPYCICSSCGIQLFIRERDGIERLEKKTGFKLDSLGFNKSESTEEKLIRLKTELREVTKAIEDDFWNEYPELPKRRDEIVRAIKKLEDKSLSW